MDTTIDMVALTDAQAEQIEGGNPVALLGIAVVAYIALLQKIESNPQEYTWMMDWYYQR